MNCPRGAALDAKLLREPERAHPVDQPEVDGLDVTALVGRDLRERHAEDIGGSRPVDVRAFLKRAQERGIGRQVRHDAQFDLRIIGGDDHASRRAR